MDATEGQICIAGRKGGRKEGRKEGGKDDMYDHHDESPLGQGRIRRKESERERVITYWEVGWALARRSRLRY